MTTLDTKASAPRSQVSHTPPVHDQRTPGDWTFGERTERYASSGATFWIGPNEVEAVAKTRQLQTLGRRGETRANARMLAAGPELIKHIRNIARLQKLAHEDTGHPELLDAIDAAVEAANRAESL